MRTRIVEIFGLLTVAAFLAAAQSANVSKRGTTAAPFLKIPQGARAVGMGGAFVASADGPSAMYWNPAGIVDLPGVRLTAEHTSWIADIQYEYIGAVVPMGPLGAVGVNVTVSNVADMKVTSILQPEGTGEIFGYTDLAVGVSYALPLTDAFAIGFTPKIIYQKIWKMSASGVAIDLGIKYRTPFKGVTLGMAVTNFGSSMQMAGENALQLHDLDPTTIGNNDHLPAYMATSSWELPLNFAVGLAYDVPIGELGRMTVAVDAMHPSDDYESLNVGGEYVFQDFLYLRAGWKSLFQVDSQEGPAAGIGIRQFLVGNIELAADYSYLDFGVLKNVQKFAVSVTF